MQLQAPHPGVEVQTGCCAMAVGGQHGYIEAVLGSKGLFRRQWFVWATWLAWHLRQCGNLQSCWCRLNSNSPPCHFGMLGQFGFAWHCINADGTNKHNRLLRPQQSNLCEAGTWHDGVQHEGRPVVAIQHSVVASGHSHASACIYNMVGSMSQWQW
jgi:hypothetical protein